MSTLRKSEVSTEFMGLVSLLIVVFISFMIAIGLKSQGVSEEIIFNDAQKVSQTLANEINFASSIEGYYREFDLPPTLANGVEYTITIINESRYVKVEWNDRSVMSNINTENVNGMAVPGNNSIRNIGGVISIES